MHVHAVFVKTKGSKPRWVVRQIFGNWCGGSAPNNWCGGSGKNFKLIYKLQKCPILNVSQISCISEHSQSVCETNFSDFEYIEGAKRNRLNFATQFKLHPQHTKI